MSHFGDLDDVSSIEERYRAGLSSFDDRLKELEKVAGAQPTSPVSSMSSECNNLRRDFEAFQDSIWAAINCLKRQLQATTQRVEELEAYARRKVLLLHGVKESEVNLESVVLDLLKKMDLQALTIDDLAACHRLGRATSVPNRSRPVLVRFVRYDSRMMAWRNKTKLKGTGVSVMEFLTPAKKAVFAEARKVFGVRKCWTQNACIFVQLPDNSRQTITSSGHLHELSNRFPLQDQTPTVKTPTPDGSTACDTVRQDSVRVMCNTIADAPARDLRPRAHIVAPAKFKSNAARVDRRPLVSSASECGRPKAK